MSISIAEDKDDILPLMLCAGVGREWAVLGDVPGLEGGRGCYRLEKGSGVFEGGQKTYRSMVE